MVMVCRRYTLDSIGEIAFGFNVDSMHKDCSFSQAFDAAQECAVDRFLWPFWKVPSVSPRRPGTPHE
jgi:hypothetical protein